MSERVVYEGQEYFLLDSLSASDMPEELRSELNYLGDLGEELCWGSAKRVQLWLDMMHSEGVHPEMMKLYALVGQECKRSAETVRMYHGVWKEIPKGILQDYTNGGKEISFHQFKALVPKLRERDADVWRDHIERWFDYAASRQVHPGSVDGIRSWLAGEYGAPSPAVGRHRRTLAGAKKLAGDPAVPDPLRTVYRHFVDRIESVVYQYGLNDWKMDP